MNENLKDFLNAISSDLDWVAGQKDLGREEAVQAALEKAAELNIPLSAADFEEPEGELSEDELVAVAGAGECYCAVGGGGTAGGSVEDAGCTSNGYVDQVCWCVMYGEGWQDRYQYGVTWTGDEQRCECPMVGAGN